MPCPTWFSTAMVPPIFLNNAVTDGKVGLYAFQVLGGDAWADFVRISQMKPPAQNARGSYHGDHGNQQNTDSDIADQYLIKRFSVSYGGVHNINGSCEAVKFGLSSSIKIYAR